MLDLITFIQRVQVKIEHQVRSALDVVRICMEEADKLPLSGVDKSAIVKAVLECDVLLHLLPDQVASSVKTMCEQNLVQPTIDLVIDASRGKMDINKSIKCCLKFWKAKAAAS